MAVSSDASPAAVRPTPGPPDTRRLGTAGWLAATLAATLVGALVPLAFRPRFYFAGDTQTGAFGQWFHLGTELLHGTWPLMNPDHWHAGNYVVEGQWGLWNPLVLLIGVLAAKATNAVVFCTVVKVAFLVLGAGGGFLLLRSYGTRASSAALGGLALTLTGFTVYMDAASWVTGLMTWALWLYAWWGIRRTAYEGRNPWPLLVAGYLLVTVGYVDATILLACTFAAFLGEALVLRRWRAAAAIGVAGLLVGLVVFTVFLPPLLSAGVTNRKSDIAAGLHYTTNGGDFLTAALPIGVRSMRLASGRVGAPLPYIAWFLPLLFLVDFRRVRRHSGELLGVALVLAAGLAVTLMPQTVGPLRFPVRALPYVATPVIVLTVIALDRALMRRPGLRRGVYAVLAAAAPAYLSLAQAPSRWRLPLFGGFVVAALVAAVWWWLQHGPEKGPLRLRHGALMAAMMVATLAVTVVQHRWEPHSPLAEWHLPARVSAYEKILQHAPGNAMLVGDPRPSKAERKAHRGSLWQDLAIANTWYIGSEDVLNTYTPVGFKAFKDRFCVNTWGATCPHALRALFRRPPGVPEARVDLMSLSTVVISKRRGGVQPLRALPAGWEVIKNTRTASVWRRARPLPGAGGVTYTSPGVRVSAVHWSDLTATFHVASTPAAGGTVTLSRLPWPGYQVTNARLAPPLDDYLLTVAVPPSSVGKTVTVHYVPPGWRTGVLLWALAVAAGAAWSLAHATRGLVRRRRGARVSSSRAR